MTPQMKHGSDTKIWSNQDGLHRSSAVKLQVNPPFPSFVNSQVSAALPSFFPTLPFEHPVNQQLFVDFLCHLCIPVSLPANGQDGALILKHLEGDMDVTMGRRQERNEFGVQDSSRACAIETYEKCCTSKTSTITSKLNT